MLYLDYKIRMEILSVKDNRALFYFIITTLSISPACTSDLIDNRNYLLIGAMFLGPLIIIFSNRIIEKIDTPIALLIITIFLTQIIFHFSTIRFSSIFFSCMYLIYFSATIRVFKRAKITANNFISVLRGLIIAYAIILLIQQFCVLTGLPVINQLGTTSDNSWKLNSLSAEPSHTSRYVGLLMYTLLIEFDYKIGYKASFYFSFRQNKWTWICFLWIMLTIQSGTAFLILIIIFARYISRQRIIMASIILTIISLGGIYGNFKPLKRSVTFVASIFTGNPKEMISADPSASVRVVPTILCLERINPFSINGWIGEGSGSISTWMSKEFPGVKKGWTGGATAGYTLEYGLLVGLLLLVFTFKWCYDPNHKLESIGFWVICLVLEGINMQMAWLCITLLYLSKQKPYINQEQSNSHLARL